jgi:hypothetical protein
LKNSILTSACSVSLVVVTLVALLAPPLIAQNSPHVIPDSEYVMDELVAVHPYSWPGQVTTSPDGSYAYAAEGGAVALILADPNVTTVPWENTNYVTPIWRAPVGSLGVTPIEMVLDPEATWDDVSDSKDLLYIAGGRDGLWVMEASEANTSPRAFRADDSGDSNPAYQAGRKWCNDIKLLELGGKTYVLALFAGVDRSNLRIYTIESLRAVAAAGNETGGEIAPQRTVYLKWAPNRDGDAYSFGMAADEVDATHAKVYVAMGEHGIFRVNLKDLGGFLQYDGTPIEYGPWFGDDSPYFDRAIVGSQRLYGTVRYYHPAGSTNPLNEVYSHAPYFLDVAVESLGAGRHRLYATVDHLGWCAFNLDAPWDDDIWSDPAFPYVAAPGYPDFIQEGKRYPIGNQANDQVRLVDDPVVPSNQRQTCSRHLDVVTTRKNPSSDPSSALVVSVSARRFIYDPSRMNEGRALTAELNVGPVHVDDYPAASNGSNNYTLVYELEHVGDTTPSPTLPNDPLWAYDGQNFLGKTLGGWELHVPEVQPDGELHLFYGVNVKAEKVPEPGTGVKTASLSRVAYLGWPDTINAQGEHDMYVSRGRFNRLGRFTLGVGPSKLDPAILVTAFNDAGLISDGPLLFDPVAKTIEAPFAVEGWTFEPGGPITAPTGTALPFDPAVDLTYGVTMDPRGGFVGMVGTREYEYRMGWHTRLLSDSGSEERFHERWRADKYDATYTAGSVTAVNLRKQLFITAPASKFSPSPYESESIDDRLQWPGRVYYSTMATFEGYNDHVKALYDQDLGGDPIGVLFAGLNGSPQGLWAVALSKLKEDVLDQNDTTYPPKDLLTPIDYSSGQASDGLFLGALVTHLEYWNVDDVRTLAVPPGSLAEYFIQNQTPEKMSHIQTWYTDAFQLPVQGETGIELHWVLAAACGNIRLDSNLPIFAPPLDIWRPEPEFIAGHGHMLVRLFDINDPLLFNDVNADHAFTTSNQDSENLPAFTILGPDDGTAAHFVRGVSVQDPGGIDRYLLFVGDLSGKLYLYDVEDLLALNTGVDPVSSSSTPNPNTPLRKQFGWFFGDAPLAVYETQRSLSDDLTNGVYGLEVVHEEWLVGPVAQEATYAYLGVPRVGVELAKLEFTWDTPSQSYLPVLTYKGRIQTPGDGSGLFVQTFTLDQQNNEGYPRSLLYVADYDGGIRIYKNPLE